MDRSQDNQDQMGRGCGADDYFEAPELVRANAASQEYPFDLGIVEYRRSVDATELRTDESWLECFKLCRSSVFSR